MTEEPYRWLEAISNRREYIRDQLKGGTPVFAISRPEGILLLGLGQGASTQPTFRQIFVLSAPFNSRISRASSGVAISNPNPSMIWRAMRT